MEILVFRFRFRLEKDYVRFEQAVNEVLSLSRHIVGIDNLLLALSSGKYSLCGYCEKKFYV